ncbi:hypothetical protein A7P89_07405 [Eikenella corrodens]|uniref:Mor transcription activator domain-containing protein n=1 Tax=Eikenella corrodens TaxID=539 RepID=A0A1A9RQ96_EIKCO|nr:Mor transcription activator family protein [Eikenella corrodens]OAM21641.1 hypothetical protein A7P89_07405 [Eikenella corrodens]
MRQIEFSEDDFRAVQHLIPEAFWAVVRVVGVSNAWDLVRHWGGTFMPVGQNRRGAGKKLHAVLVEIVGTEELAQQLETMYLAERGFYVPKCEDAFREMRDRAIRRDFDRLTGQQRYPMKAYLAVRNLALDYGLTERRVWEIMKNTDIAPPKSTAQASLFAA